MADIFHQEWFGLVVGYLLGSIPFGLLLTRIGGAGDIRAIGSGNIGATNVLRTGRKGLAAATLLLDAAKGAVAVLAMQHFNPPLQGPVLAAALGALLGHCFPVWLRFRGGKGVATMLGVMLALWWPSGLVFAAVWLAMLAVTRISSAGGMAGAVSAPLTAAYAFGPVRPTAAIALLAALVVFQHRANIGRLLRGEEPRVGSKDR
ncbi:MAG: glycerol-3-phosphate 1-O-acyltransferase PlsY [Sphingomonadales bacterium]|nr:glycerol-3-phosphate 1-O-acyltransferase PlsY [Sphingomonadales bacterium]